MENAPASRDYQPGFMVDLMVKDLGLANEIADNSAIDNSLGRLRWPVIWSIKKPVMALWISRVS
jgi:hypothetical protein